jgi:hypothetical protein
MTQTTQEKKKPFVLKAFETLFNKRDYAAADHFWSPNYIQHSAHIPPGREGLFALIKGAPDHICGEIGGGGLDQTPFRRRRVSEVIKANRHFLPSPVFSCSC